MATIYTRDDSPYLWLGYVVNGTKVYKSLRTKNRRVAQEIKKQYEAMAVSNQLRLPSQTPIAPVLEAFCRHMLAKRRPKGAKNDISCLRGFFGPCCPALELGSRAPHKYRREGKPVPVIEDRMVKNEVVRVVKTEKGAV